MNFIRLLKILIACIFITACTGEPESTGTENQVQQKANLQMISSKWISWQYVYSRIMFYYTSLQSNRCGIKQAKWGTSKEELNYTFPIGECDEERPYEIFREMEFHVVLDEIGEADNDSFITNNNEINSIAVQITYFDESESDVMVFPIPKHILNE